MAFDYKDVLAGPIVRRVEPRLASVWVALRKPAQVTLKLWEGLEFGDTATTPLHTATIHSRPIGAELHLALVTLTLPDSGPPLPLQSDTLYSYDLAIKDDADAVEKGLKGIGLLEKRSDNGENHLPLGYEDNRLPSFVLPPSNIDDLKLLLASCRLPHSDTEDAMSYPDDVLSKSNAYLDPAQRPHQLFLTGDQIYADEVAPNHLDLITQVAKKLISGDGPTVERLPFDYDDGNTITRYMIPLEHEFFPPARRQRLIRKAGLTTGYGSSHVLGFGEYAAMYLLGWSSVLWPENFFAEALSAREDRMDTYRGWLTNLRGAIENHPDWRDDEHRKLAEEKLDKFHGWRLLPPEWRRIDAALDFADKHTEWGQEWLEREDGADIGAFPTQDPPDTVEDIDAPVAPTLPGDIDPAVHPGLLRALANSLSPSWFVGTHEAGFGAARGDELYQDMTLNQLRALQDYYAVLPKLRRALANIPTYMMFDDHEVTDDWNIDQRWVVNTNGNDLGRTVVRNGLLSYALFQGWGNDPRYFEGLDGAPTPGTHLLEKAEKLFFFQGQLRVAGPSAEASDELDHLLNLGNADTPWDERVRWYYRIGGHGYEFLSLDIRTFRGFKSPDGPPELLTLPALQAQVPADPIYSYGPPPLGQGITFVISGMPVLGFTPSEYLMQPLVNLKDSLARLEPGVFEPARADYFVGKYDHDPEPWGYQEDIFEALLARLASYGQVVFVSGETHYSVAMTLDYWHLDQAEAPPPSRFVQLTCSAVKNFAGKGITMFFRSGLFHRLGEILAMPRRRMAWDTSNQDPPLVPPPGKSFNRLVQHQNNSNPALVPLSGLPEGTQRRYDPAWTWSLNFLVDERPDSTRLSKINNVPALAEPAQPGEFDGAFVDGLARRHFWQAQHGPARLVNFRSCIGLVTVDTASGAPELNYGVIHRPRELADAKPEAYMAFKVTLDASAETPPEAPPPLT